MNIHVLFFARARDLASSDKMIVEAESGATVADLRREIARRCPALADFLPKCAVALNEEFAGDHAIVLPDVVVAVIPPVSGG